MSPIRLGSSLVFLFCWVFLAKNFVGFYQMFFCVYWNVPMVYCPFFSYMVCCIDCFSYVKPICISGINSSWSWCIIPSSAPIFVGLSASIVCSFPLLQARGDCCCKHQGPLWSQCSTKHTRSLMGNHEIDMKINFIPHEPSNLLSDDVPSATPWKFRQAWWLFS